MILYAPIIEPNVPAFTGNKLTVSFQHNIAVGEQSGKMALQIKDYNTNKILATETIIADDLEYRKGVVDFSLGDLELIVGNFYKVQIAYAESKEAIGPYSTVGITRWLGNEDSISLTVKGLTDSEALNPNLIEYNGEYKYEATGLSEPVYHYKFDLINETSQIVESSGWLLPQRDSSSDTPIMKYILQNDLGYFIDYILRFTVVTVNGYKAAKDYKIYKQGLYPNQFQGKLIVKQEPEAKENAYVHLYVDPSAILVNGVFRLIRREEHDDIWDELTRFNMSEQDSINQFSWKDYSVEHGKKYYYAIQQYGLHAGVPYYSTFDEVPINEVQFEHMFLGDDTYQLKLAFNPQVSSFKETVLESKTDVIGGKYPFFFRNGNVRYKEIPISGLLSYLLDDGGFFLTTDKVSSSNYFDDEGNFVATTNLVNHNFANERQFKLAVLNWLNNGKPKLFRSPAEGNYVLRLMNISMSPNQQLGRMLHTVSATGYEVMEAKPKKMIEEKIMHFSDVDSLFQGSVTDYGDIIAEGTYKLVTLSNNSELTDLLQICAIRMVANPGAENAQVKLNYGIDTSETIKIEGIHVYNNIQCPTNIEIQNAKCEIYGYWRN